MRTFNRRSRLESHKTTWDPSFAIVLSVYLISYRFLWVKSSHKVYRRKSTAPASSTQTSTNLWRGNTRRPQWPRTALVPADVELVEFKGVPVTNLQARNRKIRKRTGPEDSGKLKGSWDATKPLYVYNIDGSTSTHLAPRYPRPWWLP